MCFMQGLKEGRLPAPIKDWEVIEATAEEAHRDDVLKFPRLVEEGFPWSVEPEHRKNPFPERS